MDLPIRPIGGRCKHGVPLSGLLCYDACEKCADDWEDAKLDELVESMSDDLTEEE